MTTRVQKKSYIIYRNMIIVMSCLKIKLHTVLLKLMLLCL